MIINIDKNNEITTRVSTTSFRFKYKYGGHLGLNPIFGLAQKLFYKPKVFHLCLNEIGKELSFESTASRHWFTTFGWSYYLNTNVTNKFINDLPKDVVTNEALLVEGECAEGYDNNKYIAKYNVHYVLPYLDSYVSDTKLLDVTHHDAIAETKSRIMYDAGFTQLNNAIKKNCLGCVKSLVSKGVNVNGPVVGGTTKQHPKRRTIKVMHTPLRLAMTKNNYEIFEYLLSQGAQDTLPFSAKNNSYKYFSLQIKSGADINEKDFYGRTALEVAVSHGCLDCVKLLVSKGVNINALYRNQTPLNMALVSNNYEMTKYLLDHGAKKELSGRGMTAYDIVNMVEYINDKRILKLFGVKK